MASTSTTISTQPPPQQQNRSATLAEVLEQLAKFDGPPEQFLAAMLQVQCKIAPSEGGTILRHTGEGKVDVLGVYPPLAPNAQAPAWLSRAVEVSLTAQGKDTIVKPLPDIGSGLYETTPSNHLILIPLRSGGITGFEAFLVNSNNPAIVARARERLELTTSLLSLYEMRQTLARRNVDLERLRESMEVVACLNEHSRMKAATMALCNEVASRWLCERVALGFLHGRYVKVAAMSHTEKFTRKMKLVQDIESAMEECLDQDIEVIHPAQQGAAYVCRAASDLANRHGPTTVLSIPLRREDKVIGVLTIERAVNKPYTIDEVETLRLMCDLCAARLSELHEHDRWIGAKALQSSRKAASWFVGAEHTWVKLIGLAIIGFLAFAIFVKGPDRIDATFIIEATQRQVVTAPYSGYLTEVLVEPNSVVKKGDIIARLDTAELTLQIAAAKAEKASYETEANQAEAEGKTAQKQIALAKAAKVDAQIDLLQHQRSQAAIVAKIDGVVIAGDLKQQIGILVEPKTILFEIAPLQHVRAELAIPEARIADVSLQSKGDMASASAPGTYLPFAIERINPVAEVVEQKNVFKARAKLDTTQQLQAMIQNGEIKIGSKGVAKINVGEKSYGYLWTRDLVNWMRMKLWL